MRNSQNEEIEIVLSNQDQSIRNKILKFIFQNKIKFDQNHNQFVAKIRIRDIPQNKLHIFQISQQQQQQNKHTPQSFITHNDIYHITEFKSGPTTKTPIKFNHIFMNQSNPFNKQENAKKHFLINNVQQQISKNFPNMNDKIQIDYKNFQFYNQKLSKKYSSINNSINQKNNFSGMKHGQSYTNFITNSARPNKNIVTKNKDKQKKKCNNFVKSKDKQVKKNQNKYKAIQTDRNKKSFYKSRQNNFYNLFDIQIQTFKKKDQQIRKLIKQQIQQLKQLKNNYLFLSDSICKLIKNKDQQQKKILLYQQGRINSNKSREVNIKDLQKKIENFDLCQQKNENNQGMKSFSQIKQEMTFKSEQSQICQEDKIKPCNENENDNDNNKKSINIKAGKKRRKIFSQKLFSKTLNIQNEKQDKDNNYKQKRILDTQKKINSQIKQDLKQTMKKAINNKSKQIKTDKEKNLFQISNLECLGNKNKINNNLNNNLINLKYFDMKDLDFEMDKNTKKSFFNNEKYSDSINQELEPNLPNNFYSIQNNSSVPFNQENKVSLEKSLKRGMFSSAQESIDVKDNDFKIDLQKLYNNNYSFSLMTTSQKLCYLELKQREANKIYKKYFC